MAGIEMNYEDVKEIFKENLKIQSLVKSIQSIFLNFRFTQKIDYKPYFQRNYVWDDEKATYFIESILLGTEIPPLVFFQTKTMNEIIDGRQRYETLQRFISDRLVLKEEGLHRLKILSGKRYSQFDEKTKEIFENTKIRILQCSVVNEPKLDEEKEDKIKKEIFRRYNSGITPLQKEEIARAEFIEDELTNKLKTELNNNDDMFASLAKLFLPKRKRNVPKRDKVNILLNKIRTLITLPYIPIYNYANGTSKSDIIRKYYYDIVIREDIEETLENFKLTIGLLSDLSTRLVSNLYKDNTLVYESIFWGIFVCLKKSIDISIINMEELAEIINNEDTEKNGYIWNGIAEDSREIRGIYEQTGSHYYKSINNRYLFVSNYFKHNYRVKFDTFLKDNESYKAVMDANTETRIFERYKLNKTDPVSITIYDIVQEMEKSKFLIRPSYQRAEVVNQQKSSYLLESILLGIKIPPLFIFKRKDGVKEVIDGQQRLLTLIGFLGKKYLDEEGKAEVSKKYCFKLSKLRILDNLNGKNIKDIGEKYEDVIWDFPLDIIEIDEEQNPDFSAIDLFLRLNTKPYPIKDNTFEMWNAYIDKDIILKVREIAEKYEGKVFRPKDTRMKNEELITSLGYLEYKNIKDKVPSNDLLGIYIRNGKLSGRVNRKEKVTNALSEASENRDKIFLNALEKVEDFIDKISYLVEYEYSNLGRLFSTKKGIQSKTDQNFYFLWLMLHDISKTEIKEKRGKYVDLIISEFKKIQKLDDSEDTDQVIINMIKLLN